MQNATVGALTVAYMVRETLEHYADAIGTDMDLNDMSNMKSMSIPALEECSLRVCLLQ